MVCSGIQQPFSDLPSEYRVMRTEDRVLGDYNVWIRAHRNHIPVSAKVASLQDEIESRDRNARHAFVARWRLCEYETVYTKGDVQGFDGDRASESQERALRELRRNCGASGSSDRS
jgi:hypothetical protein